MIVVFEGIDGSGKDTQLELLRKNIQFTYFKYPTPNNEKIKLYLEKKIEIDGSELVDLFLEDIYKEQEKIRKMGKKELAIVDRYVFSTIAYEAHLVPLEEIKKRIEKMDFIKPDKVILLDISAQESYKRKKKQKELDRYEENIGYLENVRNNFLKLYQSKYYAKKWAKIDASDSIEEVYEKIRKELP